MTAVLLHKGNFYIKEENLKLAMLRHSESLLTFDDYELFPMDGKRHEIIKGEHYMTPAPGTKHQNVLRIIGTLINDFLREKKIGIIFFSPIDVIFSNYDVVQPDLIFISKERMEIITEKNIKGAPDLVIEILSENSLKEDKLTKKKLYEKFGVNEYWIVDPFAETIELFSLKEEKFKKHKEFEGDEILESPLLSGFNAALNNIFAPIEV